MKPATVCLLTLLAAGCGGARAFGRADRDAVAAVLERQRIAWNRGDLDAYMSGYARTPGNRGVLMLRQDVGDRCEFLMVSLWDSMAAVTTFAGPQPDKAVFYPEDDRYLVERDLTVQHYEIDTAVLDPAISTAGPSPERAETLEPPLPPTAG